jgi:tetratricopeptide (TPR) repeat protein
MRTVTLLVACALVLFLSASLTQAEQIRLADGRYLQGEVVEVKDNGFMFRRTDTGGRVFLRWGQVDDSLKRRLTNQRDPDEDLNLEVMVEGARLELLDGTIYEGQITLNRSSYQVINRDFPRGRNVPASEVAEDGFIPDIMIEAVAMMSEEDALDLAVSRREPLEMSQQYYELARIADIYGLYERAKDFVTTALSMNPEPQLEVRLSEYEVQLDELIRQQGVLEALTEARQLARRRQFQTALNTLDEAHTEYNPTDGVLARWQTTRDEIDIEFNEHVIRDWHSQVRSVIRRKVREDNLTVQEAMAWARRQLDVEVMERIAETVGSDNTNDIRVRFNARHQLERAGIIRRLTTHRASFGQDGFYTIVGGHLPVAGRQPSQNPGDARERERERPRRPGGGGGGGGNRNMDHDSGTVADALKDLQFQQRRGGGGGAAGEIQDLLDRLGGGEGREGGRGEDGGGIGRQDLSHLRVPNTVPPLNEWWERASTARKASWLTAFYAINGGTMQVVDLSDWNVRYK